MFIIYFFLTFGAKGTEPAQFAEALPLGMRCGLDVKTFSMTAAILVLSAFVPELATVTYTHVMLLHHSFFFYSIKFFRMYRNRVGYNGIFQQCPSRDRNTFLYTLVLERKSR